MQVNPVKTRIFKENEDLSAFIRAHVKKLPEGSVLVVTSKIVALAEGRTKLLGTEKDKERVIRAESDFALRTKWVWLTLKDKLVIAGAGVDESNANGKLILLPKDSYKAAALLRQDLMKRYKLRNLGVVITDSRVLPLRSGVMGVALGYAGFKGLRDYTKRKDIFGRAFRFEKLNMADCLASSAITVMGEGDERQPLAVITSAPVEFTERVSRNELSIDPADDLYLPFFSAVPKGFLKRKR